MGSPKTFEEYLISSLSDWGYTSASDPCLVQSFELTSMQKMRDLGSQLRLIFLIGKEDRLTPEYLDMYKWAWNNLAYQMWKIMIFFSLCLFQGISMTSTVWASTRTWSCLKTPRTTLSDTTLNSSKM